MKDFSVPQKPLTRSEILEDAQAMQRRFAEQTANQILVCERLTAQRDALADCCERMLNALSGFYEEHEDMMIGWRQDVADALALDPEARDGSTGDAG